MNQIPNDPAKTKQLRSNLKLSEGERVETAINVRTEDDITNGAAGVIKFIHPHQIQKPKLLRLFESNFPYGQLLLRLYIDLKGILKQE